MGRLSPIALTLVLAMTATARGYLVGPPPNLDEQFNRADLVCKAVVVATRAAGDTQLPERRDYPPKVTELRVITVFRGKPELKSVVFQHYGDGGGWYTPIHYRFEVGRPYIIFAKATGTPGVFEQVSKDASMMSDEGVLLAAGEDAAAPAGVKDLFWRELTRLLKGDRADDVVYALRHLDNFSGDEYIPRDFDRRLVLDTIEPLMKHVNGDVARAAITVMGSRNPCMPEMASSWLSYTTQLRFEPRDFDRWFQQHPVLGGQLHWRALAEVADSRAPAQTRALAIRAMGRGGAPEVLKLAERWAHDAAPEVRAAAAVLMADYPDKADRALLMSLAADASPMVRIAAGYAAGLGKLIDMAPAVAHLLDDADPQVSKEAAVVMQSLPLSATRDELRARLRTSEHWPLFVNALAREHPDRYVDDLIAIIRKKAQPEHWDGGQIPWGVSWDILFRHVQRQPEATVRLGNFDKVFDALESPAADREPGGGFHGSSEPRDLYALYLRRNLKERAAKFRALCKKNFTYDIEYFFKMVDENPATYERQ